MKKLLTAVAVLMLIAPAVQAQHYGGHGGGYRGGYERHEGYGYRGGYRNNWIGPVFGGALLGGALYGGYNYYNRPHCYTEGAIDYYGRPVYDDYGNAVLTTRCN